MSYWHHERPQKRVLQELYPFGSVLRAFHPWQLDGNSEDLHIPYSLSKSRLPYCTVDKSTLCLNDQFSLVCISTQLQFLSDQ